MPAKQELPIERPRKGQKSRRNRRPDPDDTACQRSGMRGRQESGMKKPAKKWKAAETKINRPQLRLASHDVKSDGGFRIRFDRD